MLHYAPLPKTMWSSSRPVKHWQAPILNFFFN